MQRNPIAAPLLGKARVVRAGRARLTWAGWVALVGAYIVGVIFFLWAGYFLGVIWGLDAAAPSLNAPGRNVGLAPDLTGLVNATGDFIIRACAGLAGGLLAGLVLMGVVCRFVLLPLARLIPGLSNRDRGNDECQRPST
jgi:hypothetical protein